MCCSQKLDVKVPQVQEDHRRARQTVWAMVVWACARLTEHKPMRRRTAKAGAPAAMASCRLGDGWAKRGAAAAETFTCIYIYTKSHNQYKYIYMHTFFHPCFGHSKWGDVAWSPHWDTDAATAAAVLQDGQAHPSWSKVTVAVDYIYIYCRLYIYIYIAIYNSYSNSYIWIRFCG